jgi:hypothetical protein
MKYSSYPSLMANATDQKMLRNMRCWFRYVWFAMYLDLLRRCAVNEMCIIVEMLASCSDNDGRLSAMSVAQRPQKSAISCRSS